MEDVLARARGCLLGQLAGDSLGSLVEFRGPEQIRAEYPQGVRTLHDGGHWNTLAGQPTDDSEMALMLARSLTASGRFDAEAVRQRYVHWLNSQPFDAGNTICAGLLGRADHGSQANGSLMRISPLGIFGARFPEEEVAAWAAADARLTHPHPVCVQATQLFALALARAVRTGSEPVALYQDLRQWAKALEVDPALWRTIEASAEQKPKDFMRQQGWVLIAFGNAWWQLLNAPSLEEGVVDTVMCGGDTDTNAAICGALLGAVHGDAAIPAQWKESVLDCRPEAGKAGVMRPRPAEFWPVDALELAEALAGAAF